MTVDTFTARTATANVACVNGHDTTTPMFHPLIEDDGTVSGAVGSDANYCQVCGAAAEVASVTLGKD
jgi:hypothetical protein